jgi:hypothetical protein
MELKSAWPTRGLCHRVVSQAESSFVLQFDEWVEATRLMKHGKSTIELAERLQQDVASKSAKKGDIAGAGGKRKRVDAEAETEQGTETPTTLRFTFPFVLKRHLVEDWENIVQKCAWPASAPLIHSATPLSDYCPRFLCTRAPTCLQKDASTGPCC